MGKGDIKSKKGKIANHSFGNSRKHKTVSDKAPSQATGAKVAAKGPTTKAPAAPTPGAANS